jgi:hypothetical protein
MIAIKQAQQLINDARDSVFRLESVLETISWDMVKSYEAYNDMLDGLNAALCELEKGLQK